MKQDPNLALRRVQRGFAALIVVAGLLATLWMSNNTKDQSAQKQSTSVSAASDQISAAGSSALQTAITDAQRMSLSTVAQWPSPQQYARQWAARADAAAALSMTTVVAVPPAERDAFVAAERDFIDALSVLPLETDEDHLIVVRTVGTKLAPGTDLARDAELSARLKQIPFAHIDASFGDTMTPGDARQRRVTDSPQPFTLTFRARAKGPTTNRVDSWTAIELDLEQILARSIAPFGDTYGTNFTIDGLGSGGTFGPPHTSGAPVEERTTIVGPFKLTSETWSASTAAGGLAAFRTGLPLTALLALLSWFAVGFVAQRRRAGISEIAASMDHLTGIPNRRWVSHYLASDVERHSAVLFCDLDRFKVVNDSAGHEAGDKVLIEVAERIVACLGEDSVAARFGGDEFLIITSGIRTNAAEHAQTIANRIRSEIARPFNVPGGEFRTTMSIGIATYDDAETTSGDEMIRAADIALGLAKKRGRNRAEIYDDGLRADELDRLNLERDLQQALDTEDFVVYYQPIVSADRSVVSYEALVRWVRNGELLTPAQFLPLVADINRESDLGAAVIRIALSEFEASAPRETTLHVNIDESQLRDAFFPTMLKQAIATTGIDPARLLLELTEGEWLESGARINSTLSAVRSLGVRFSIDDFGSGHSTLARTFSVDGVAELKLDGTLTQMLRQERTHMFLRGFVDSAKQAGLSTLVEGIETEDEMRWAVAVGVESFQGYLFGRPAPAELAFGVGRSPAMKSGAINR